MEIIRYSIRFYRENPLALTSLVISILALVISVVTLATRI